MVAVVDVEKRAIHDRQRQVHGVASVREQLHIQSAQLAIFVAPGAVQGLEGVPEARCHDVLVPVHAEPHRALRGEGRDCCNRRVPSAARLFASKATPKSLNLCQIRQAKK